MGKQLTRRDFLHYSLASSVVLGNEASLLGKEPLLKELFKVAAANPTSSIFPQSVASGDPQTDGITLWTRLAPQSEPTKVAFQVASDSDFSQIVLMGMANTDETQDYTTKVRLQSGVLQPFTTYYYRFIFNNTASPTGRFKTLPAPNADVEKIRFGYISCQDYTKGYYTALHYLAEEDIDFVVHLGDYIYENVSVPKLQERSIQLPSGESKAQNLEDYRFLYQTCKSDANLQRLHENFAFISIWDDHEYANDCYKEYTTDTTSEIQNFSPERRQAANQAWAEYTPTSMSFYPQQDSTSSLQIYRKFTFGNLLDLVLTDERLYRDSPPCGLAANQRRGGADCAARNNQDRTMLGLTQRQWFLNQICNSACVWKIWCNEVVTMQLKVRSPLISRLLKKPSSDLFLSLDSWDGYAAERNLIFTELKNSGVKNLVTITGDIHTYVAGYQRIKFDNPFVLNTVPADAVGVEFVVGSVTSSNIAETIGRASNKVPLPPIGVITKIFKQNNPHIQYFNSTTHGYNLVEVTHSALTCTFKAVSTITAPRGTLSTLKVFRVKRDRILLEEYH